MSYWLISVPNETKDGNSKITYDNLNRNSSAVALSKNSPFPIPQLKVGTLDSLMSLSDDLAKFDTQVGQISKKIEKTYYDYLKAENADGSAPLAGELKVNNLSAREFVEKFQWNKVRYPERSALRTLVDLIIKEANKSDEALRKQIQDYNEVRSAFSAIERKDTGTLLVKPLAPYVKEKEIIEKGHLTTVLLVIPRSRELEFESGYELMEDEGRKKEAAEKERREKEKLERENKEKERNEQLAKTELEKKGKEEKEAAEASGHHEESSSVSGSSSSAPPLPEEEKPKKPLPCKIVVPRSAKKLYDDPSEEYILYRVVVIREGSEYFKSLCRERRYTVRPFALNAAEEKEEKERKVEFAKKKKALWSYLLRWCATSYSEVFSAWIHIKAIRIYVEAVLRYGLPVNFSSFLLEPAKGKDKQLRTALKSLYGKLAGSNANLTQSLEANEVDLSGFGADFYPYVYLPLSIVD